jgi:D-arginine dehydrogenase
VRRWAGLRSFVADHDPVLGPDPDAPGFFWLAGQGGFGIMTAPAMARIAACLIRSGDAPATTGLDPTRLGPARLRAS